MGTYNAIYVRNQPDNRTVTSLINECFPAARIEKGSEFIEVVRDQNDFVVPESVLADLSLQLKTDVIWVGIQSSVDAFVFHHWQEGKHLRGLVYGMEKERTWEIVSGKAESWEHDAFFSLKSLESELESASTDKKRKTLERFWNSARLSIGKTIPSFDSRDCAHKIASFYRFPGYGCNEQDSAGKGIS